ncbi:hypothetical protein [Sphingomonas profundi]|uniref:hypothetical protein n=1 Tax=Alterirhizorhabdus profundi TaxID=2681549 RepID=UPI0012E7F12A|nr:hypothetical protein [Sphingomonas profundi]
MTSIIRTLPLAAMLALGVASVPAAAQPVDPASPQTTPPSPANAAANVVEKPVTQELNNAVQTNLVEQQVMTAEQQGQYAIDRATYRAEVEKSARQMTRDMVRYDRQQDAYARAMLAWRQQTDECKRGILKSCKKPTPMPSDFY